MDRAGNDSNGSRLALAVGVVAAVAIVAMLVWLLAPKDWRTQAENNRAAMGVVGTVGPNADICTQIPEIPAKAGRAEFRITAGDTLTAQVSVQRASGPPRRSAPQTVRAQRDGRLSLALPSDVVTDLPATVCLEPSRGRSKLFGEGGLAALRLLGRERQTWISNLPTMFERTERMKGTPLKWLGGWRLALLMVVTIGLAVAVAVRTWSRPESAALSRATWLAVAVVALFHAWTWAVLTPGFQVPDEASHLQYVSYIADHGDLPSGREVTESPYSDSQHWTQVGLQVWAVANRPEGRAPWSREAERQLEARLRTTSSDVPDVQNTASGQPPLYYLSVAPAAALAGGSALNQLGAIRIASGFWLAIAALGAIALLRALVPRRPRWAVTAGLVIALYPLLGFMAGGVTPDAAMAALAIWTFAAAVACWTRGISLRTLVPAAIFAVLLGLTKLTALAILPGVGLIVAAALIRDALRPGELRAVLRALAGAIAAAAVVLGLYALLASISDRPLVPGSVGAVAAGSPTGGAAVASWRETLSSSWQLFLPHLPFQNEWYAGFPLWDIWLQGLIGRFGLDYQYPMDVREIVLGVWLAIVALAIVGIGRIVIRNGWRALANNAVVLVGSLVALGSLMIVIGRADLISTRAGGPPFQQARYLLPALPLGLMVLGLALRALPTRWRPLLGVGLIGAATLWVILAWALTLQRYYS